MDTREPYFDRRALWLPLAVPLLLAAIFLSLDATIKEPTTPVAVIVAAGIVLGFAPLYYGLPYLVFLALVYRRAPTWTSITTLRVVSLAPLLIAAAPAIALAGYSALDGSMNPWDGIGEFFAIALVVAYAYAFGTLALGRYLARRKAQPATASTQQP